MRKNQRPNQVIDPWYIPVVPTSKPAVPTSKPDFGAVNCLVRVLTGACPGFLKGGVQYLLVP